MRVRFFPGEEEGFAFPGRMPGGLSGESRQGVDAGAHVSRLADEPEGMRAQHRLSSRMMAAMPAGACEQYGREMLAGWSGTLVADGYAGYSALFRDGQASESPVRSGIREAG